MHPPASRILIVRLSSLGDVVHSLPVLCALRARLPRAFLAWVVEDWAAELLQDHPALDRLVVLPRDGVHHLRSPWWRVAANSWRLARALRPLCFDTAIDVQGLTRSAWVGWLSGARRRVGYDGSDGRQRSRLFNNTRVLPTRVHVVERGLELLLALGIESPEVRFGLPPFPEEAARVERLLAGMRVGSNGCVLVVGASRASKRWAPDRFASLADGLRQRHGLIALVLAGEASEERALAAEVVARSAGHALLLPPLTLREVASLCRQTRLTVGADSAVLHLAAAVGATCVGLYGPTPSSRNGPYGRGHRVVESTDGTMAGCSPYEVSRACDAALTEPPPAPHPRAPRAGRR